MNELYSGNRRGFVYDSFEKGYVKVLDCPFCGSDDLALLPTANGNDHVLCRNCGANGPSWDLEGSSTVQDWNSR